MRKNNSNSRGFTLIELMIVVAILAVLAAVAIVGYGQYTESAKSSEATSILADIRLKQEAYRATFHQYSDVSNGMNSMPDKTPSSEARSWPTNGDVTTMAGRWRHLGVTPDHMVYFSYYCRAGGPGETPDEPFDTAGLENLDDFWFAAMALQDLDDDGEFAGFETYSGSQRMVELEEGEITDCP